jgi:transposase-like protein
MGSRKIKCLICDSEMQLIYKKAFRNEIRVYTYKCSRCNKYWRATKLIKHKEDSTL